MSLDIVDGSRIIYNDVSYRFRERRGEHLDWVSERTRDLVTFTDSELLERTSDGTIIFHEPGIRYDSETHLEVAGDPNQMAATVCWVWRRARIPLIRWVEKTA